MIVQYTSTFIEQFICYQTNVHSYTVRVYRIIWHCVTHKNDIKRLIMIYDLLTETHPKFFLLLMAPIKWFSWFQFFFLSENSHINYHFKIFITWFQMRLTSGSWSIHYNKYLIFTLFSSIEDSCMKKIICFHCFIIILRINT